LVGEKPWLVCEDYRRAGDILHAERNRQRRRNAQGATGRLGQPDGQQVDKFVEALLRRIADADVRFERGVPVFPRRPGALTITVEDVGRILDGDV
jgi:hypothetical protein